MLELASLFCIHVMFAQSFQYKKEDRFLTDTFQKSFVFPFWYFIVLLWTFLCKSYPIFVLNGKKNHRVNNKYIFAEDTVQLARVERMRITWNPDIYRNLIFVLKYYIIIHIVHDSCVHSLHTTNFRICFFLMQCNFIQFVFSISQITTLKMSMGIKLMFIKLSPVAMT